MPLRVAELYAFVGTDENGDEGVAAFCLRGVTGDTWLPLVGADRERVQSLRPYAERVARETGRPVTLCRFTEREEKEVIQP